MRDIGSGTRRQVIHAHHMGSVFKETVAQMRANKSRAARDENSSSQTYCETPFSAQSSSYLRQPGVST